MYPGLVINTILSTALISCGLGKAFKPQKSVSASDQGDQNQGQNDLSTPKTYAVWFELPPLAQLGLTTADGLEYTLDVIPMRAKCSWTTQRKQDTFVPQQIVTLAIPSPCDLQVTLTLGPKGQGIETTQLAFGYKEHIAPLLKTHCEACHNPESGRTTDSLHDYALAYSRRDSVKNHVARGTMPPKSWTPLFPDEVLAITQWVEQGAPESVPSAAIAASGFFGSRRIAIEASEVIKWQEDKEPLKGEFRKYFSAFKSQ